MDVHLRGRGDGVLTRSQEKELPGVDFGLVPDALGNVLPGVAGGAVFLTVGQDGERDVVRPVRRWEGGETLSKTINGVADGIEQGGTAARDVGFDIQRYDLGDGDGVKAGLDGGIKEDETEAVVPRRGLLITEEDVETVDGGLADRLHGAGAVEDEGEFGFHEDGDYGVGLGRSESGGESMVRHERETCAIHPNQPNH